MAVLKNRENGRSIRTILCVPRVSVHCLRSESGVFRQLWIDFQCYLTEKESSNQSPQHWLIHAQVYGCLSTSISAALNLQAAPSAM